MEEKSTEYTEAMSTIRHLHEYRLKILQFFLAFNGVFMVIVFAHLDDEPGWVRVSISTFALMSSFIMLMIERVTMQLAHMIWKRLVDIEKERNFATMRVLWDYKESTVNSQKLWIKIFYFIVMVFWISVIVYFSIYSITTSGLTPGNGPT